MICSNCDRSISPKCISSSCKKCCTSSSCTYEKHIEYKKKIMSKSVSNETDYSDYDHTAKCSSCEVILDKDNLGCSNCNEIFCYSNKCTKIFTVYCPYVYCCNCRYNIGCMEEYGSKICCKKCHDIVPWKCSSGKSSCKYSTVNCNIYQCRTCDEYFCMKCDDGGDDDSYRYCKSCYNELTESSDSDDD